MAGIDKIYGTREEWCDLYFFLAKNKPDWLTYMYKKPPPQGKSPLSNFPKDVDMWMLENCKLPFVVDRIKEQYGMKND